MRCGATYRFAKGETDEVHFVGVNNQILYRSARHPAGMTTVVRLDS
jgi:hypothetical protein